MVNRSTFLVFLPRDLKKCTGDWFYDQRVNRFSTAPGHDIVRASLRKRPPSKCRKQIPDNQVCFHCSRDSA